MRVTETAENVRDNEQHYDRSYRDVDVQAIVDKIADFDRFFSDALRTDTSWRGLYQHGFAEQLSGQRVLELGCGDGTNALVMAKLGAEVVAIDISSESARVVEEAAQRLEMQDRVQAVAGDFAEVEFEPHSFDVVVGKAFLHHLTHELESAYLARAAGLLKPNGHARFFEPAVNSATLDRLRWMLPIGGRPSSLRRAAFERWKELDPHPERSNHWRAYAAAAESSFEQVDVFPLGSVERLHKLLPGGDFNRRFRRAAHGFDERLPRWLRLWLARSQLLIYREPKIAAPRCES